MDNPAADFHFDLQQLDRLGVVLTFDFGIYPLISNLLHIIYLACLKDFNLPSLITFYVSIFKKV